MPLPVLGLGSGVGKSLLKSKTKSYEDPPLRPGKKLKLRPSFRERSFPSLNIRKVFRVYKTASSRGPPGKGVFSLRFFVILLFVPFILNAFFLRLWDAGTARRVIDWSDTTSTLVYQPAEGVFEYAVVYALNPAETLLVDTIEQSPSMVEAPRLVIPDYFKVKASGSEVEVYFPGVSERLEFNLYDVAGRRVLSERGLYSGVARFSLDDLPSGSYMADVRVSGRELKAKLTVVDGRVVGLKTYKPGLVKPVGLEAITERELARVAFFPDTLDTTWLAVSVRELEDTLTPPPGDTGQPWIGAWYNIDRWPFRAYMLDDTLDLLMIPFKPLTAADTLGNLYFPGGWLQGLQRLTSDTNYRFGDAYSFSSIPLRIMVMTANHRRPVLDSLPTHMEPLFWEMIDEVVSGTDSMLPLVVIPFDSSRVHPPLPDSLPFPTGSFYAGAPDDVVNAVLFWFGNSLEGGLAHPGPGWTTTYSAWAYDSIWGWTDVLVKGACCEIDVACLPPYSNLGIMKTLRRELGRAIALDDRGPPVYIMSRPEYPYSGDYRFHPDELLIIKLQYGLPLWHYTGSYKIND